MNVNRQGAAAPPKMNIAARLGGIILVILGLLFVVTSLLGFLPEDPRMTVTGLVLFLVLGLVLGGAGFAWLRRQSSDAETEQAARQEQAVLELLARSKGEITLGDVSRQLSLPPATAEAVLARLTSQRMVEPELNAEGAVVYRAKELL